MSNKRCEYINFRVSPEEKRALDNLVINEGRTQSEMMRELLREGLKRRGLQAIVLSKTRRPP